MDMYENLRSKQFVCTHYLVYCIHSKLVATCEEFISIELKREWDYDRTVSQDKTDLQVSEYIWRVQEYVTPD